jgi:hypothetical protein
MPIVLATGLALAFSHLRRSHCFSSDVQKMGYAHVLHIRKEVF